MKHRALTVAKHAIIILVIGLLYGLFVTITGIGIPCMFHEVTGFQCPGCGVSRMCLALMRFDIVSAYSYNKGLFVMLPALFCVFAHMIYRYIRFNKTKTTKVQTTVLIIIAALLVLWGIIRNIIAL